MKRVYSIGFVGYSQIFMPDKDVSRFDWKMCLYFHWNGRMKRTKAWNLYEIKKSYNDSFKFNVCFMVKKKFFNGTLTKRFNKINLSKIRNPEMNSDIILYYPTLNTLTHFINSQCFLSEKKLCIEKLFKLKGFPIKRVSYNN